MHLKETVSKFYVPYLIFIQTIFTLFYNNKNNDDKVLVLLSPVCFECRHLNDEDVSLIREIKAFGTETYLFYCNL